jgi:catechol 2,3-dioxygenase-like lactoylglutathione lyase family enzyme
MSREGNVLEDLMSHLALIALVVRDYDAALDFFVNVLQFEVVEDVLFIGGWWHLEGNHWDLLGRVPGQ